MHCWMEEKKKSSNLLIKKSQFESTPDSFLNMKYFTLFLLFHSFLTFSHFYTLLDFKRSVHLKWKPQKFWFLSEMSFRSISNFKTCLHRPLTKNFYITHQIESSFASRVSSQTLFLRQIYYKSKTFFSSLEFNPIFPADSSWALRSISGRKHWISLYVFDKEQHSWCSWRW